MQDNWKGGKITTATAAPRSTNSGSRGVSGLNKCDLGGHNTAGSAIQGLCCKN
jgi:hypothetical protein